MTIADSMTRHGSCETATAQPSSQRQSVAWLLLCAALFGLGLYILANYLHALAWALVLAIALWPFYKRVVQRTSSRLGLQALPLVFALLVGIVLLLPIGTLVIDAVREFQEIADYSRTLGNQDCRRPISCRGYLISADGGGAMARASFPCGLGERSRRTNQHVDDASARRGFGADALHRTILFAVCLLTLFFLFRHGDSVSAQCRTALQKLFGERGRTHCASDGRVRSWHGGRPRSRGDRRGRPDGRRIPRQTDCRIRSYSAWRQRSRR